MRIYHDHRIFIVHDESDASQVNRAYGRLVAKRDKSSIRDALEILRRNKQIIKVVDQWSLIHVALAVVWQCTAKI